LLFNLMKLNYQYYGALHLLHNVSKISMPSHSVA